MEITYITTSYRDARYLKACNRSVRKQRNINAKHLIIIDGYQSKELTEFVREVKECERTTIIENSENKGKSKCVNQALQMCNSRYIGLLDADDLIFADKTWKQIQFLKNNEAKSVVGCSYISFLDNNKTNMQFINAPTQESEAWSKICISPTSLYSSLIIDRNRYKEPLMDETLDCAMDYKFNLNCLTKGIITNIQGYHCGYRVRNQSITRSEKRVNQLLNHSKILIEGVVSETSITLRRKKLLMKSFALGLCSIARETEYIKQLVSNYFNEGVNSREEMVNNINPKFNHVNNRRLIYTMTKIIEIGNKQKNLA